MNWLYRPRATSAIRPSLRSPGGHTGAEQPHKILAVVGASDPDIRSIPSDRSGLASVQVHIVAFCAGGADDVAREFVLRPDIRRPRRAFAFDFDRRGKIDAFRHFRLQDRPECGRRVRLTR